MAQTIRPEDLGRKVFKFGGYYLAEDSVITKPELFLYDKKVPIIPKFSSNKYHTASDKDKHFVQDFYPLSFSLVKEDKLNREDVPVFNLKMFPARDTDTHKIVYLPYYDNNITSITIPPGDKSARYFMTDKLSGCNLYIDRRKNGELVCYHANAQHVKPDDVQGKMDEMHSTAKKTGDENKVSLSKANYYAKALESEAQIVEGQTDRKFSGATTIMGFPADNGQWEFHFQTYGRITYTIEEIEETEEIKETGSFKPGKVMGKIMGKLHLSKEDLKGKGKEVDPTGKGKVVKRRELEHREVPLEIIDYGRFWP